VVKCGFTHRLEIILKFKAIVVIGVFSKLEATQSTSPKTQEKGEWILNLKNKRWKAY
jgi:hypothetical protein